MEEKRDPKVILREIIAKASAMGVTGKQIASLESMKILSAKRNCRRKQISYWLMIIPLVTVAIALTAIIQKEIYTLRGLLKFCFSLEDNDLLTEKCTLSMLPLIEDLVRPPSNCSICKDILNVDRVSKIAKEVFQERYAYTKRPVIISDATQNWTASKVFNFEFFRSIYSDDSQTLDHLKPACQFFPYQTEFTTLREVFSMNESRANMTDGSEPWYIGWSNCDSSAFSELRRHYSTPYFLPSDAESSTTDWIFMGCPGYGAHYHIDNVTHPSWQAQISGMKKWTLYPPLECYLECHSLETTVEPGDIIVLDTNWWYHETLIVGDRMSITIGSEYD